MKKAIKFEFEVKRNQEDNLGLSEKGLKQAQEALLKAFQTGLRDLCMSQDKTRLEVLPQTLSFELIMEVEGIDPEMD